MKKKIFLFLSMSLALLVLAQNKMNFHLVGGFYESINLSDIDTVRFTNGSIKVEGKANNVYQVTNVDSVTFSLDANTNAKGDTVFITYNGNNASVVNPYSNVVVQQSGANVTILSSEQKKGIVYYLSGTSADGSFQLTPDKGYTLVFDNLNLTHEDAPIILNEGTDGESYTAQVHLKGASVLTDGSSNTYKGALYTKSKLKVSLDTLTTESSLTITGNKKHAINSSKRVEVYSGKIAIAGAQSDGINADGLEMYGGELTIEKTSGDGVDCSELIQINDGTVTIATSTDDTKGLKCDSIVEINGGTLSINVSGAGSKAVKSGIKTIVSGGVLTAQLEAMTAFGDTSYNAAISSNGNIELTENGKVIVKGAGVAAKAFNSDADVLINGGELTVELTGTHLIANNDTVSVYGIKADGDVEISGGTTSITISENAKVAKGIKATNMNVTAGTLTINNGGGYFSSNSTTNNSSSQNSWNNWNNWNFGGGGQSSTSSEYETAKAIKLDGTLTITGGEINLTAALGKGIVCDGDITLGTLNGADSDYNLMINAGSEQCGTYSKSGGMESRKKVNASPKAIKSDGTISINSGTVDIYAYDTGILAQYVTVNGGQIEVDAPYDQALFGKKQLTLNGGYVKVPSSYEALSGAIITFNEGSNTYVISSDDAWNATDGNTSSSAVHIYVKGGTHYAQAGGDGLDSNGDMTVSGGIVVVCQTSNANSPLDTDSGWSHTGGFVMAVGSNGMFSESVPTTSQGHIYNKSMTISQNNYLIVANQSGSVLAALKVAYTSQAAVCAYNGVSSSTYQFYVGSSYSGTMNYFDGKFGLYTTNQPAISTGNYTSYTGNSSNGSSGGGFPGGGGFR